MKKYSILSEDTGIWTSETYSLKEVIGKYEGREVTVLPILEDGTEEEPVKFTPGAGDLPTALADDDSDCGEVEPQVAPEQPAAQPEAEIEPEQPAAQVDCETKAVPQDSPPVQLPPAKLAQPLTAAGDITVKNACSSQKSKISGRRIIAIILAVVPLCFALGGLHRLYLGKTASGALMLLTGGGFIVVQLFDIIMLLCGKFRDGYDRIV